MLRAIPATGLTSIIESGRSDASASKHTSQYQTRSLAKHSSDVSACNKLPRHCLAQ